MTARNDRTSSLAGRGSGSSEQACNSNTGSIIGTCIPVYTYAVKCKGNLARTKSCISPLHRTLRFIFPHGFVPAVIRFVSSNDLTKPKNASVVCRRGYHRKSAPARP